MGCRRRRQPMTASPCRFSGACPLIGPPYGPAHGPGSYKIADRYGPSVRPGDEYGPGLAAAAARRCSVDGRARDGGSRASREMRHVVDPSPRSSCVLPSTPDSAPNLNHSQGSALVSGTTRTRWAASVGCLRSTVLFGWCCFGSRIQEEKLAWADSEDYPIPMRNLCGTNPSRFRFPFS